ncbi:MAG TPA: TetR/AcrR family transcriptional regulator [Xanthobacteraceae bacterium]|nr:TetR/AcrR family transcriptional regulator [Xanthobacteraceae bacterium]
MVQKSAARRGRPRAYDPDAALTRALNAFWDAGFAATSLDDLTEATGMNRPSLYGAFGDKQALYRQALDFYRTRTREALAKAFGGDDPLPVALRKVYDTAISIYLSGDNGPRGCFIIGTAVAQAVTHPDIRAALADTLREIDGAFAARIARARRGGELPGDADPARFAKLASATLYSLTIHARAGEGRAALEAIADAAVDVICGPPKRRGPNKAR